MLKFLVISLLLVGTNGALYADCYKCCGDHVLDAIHHRWCTDDENPLERCHVSECTYGFGFSCGESCVGSWGINDVCAATDWGDWGMHGCGI